VSVELERSAGGARPQATVLEGQPSRLDDLFAEAAADSGTIVRCYAIAGQPLELRFAGPALVPSMARALAHLESEDGRAPALVVNVWDSLSTRTQAPPLPTIDRPVLQGTQIYSEDERFQAAYQPGFDTLTVLDNVRNVAWSWAGAAGAIPYWDHAAPIRRLLHWWLGRRRVVLLHGGAVGLATGGVLLVGRGGSGKSTASLTALLDGLRYAGDDYVAVQLEPEPYVHSLYSSGKLEPHHIKSFPELSRAVWNAERLDEEKAIVYGHELRPEGTIAGFPLRAVLLPKVVDRIQPRVVPTTAGAALAALAPSTLFQLHPPTPDALAIMSALVQRVPAFTLELGSDMRATPRTIAALLAELGVAE
jgi:hypothetical protein